jgi:hypothetical protein
VTFEDFSNKMDKDELQRFFYEDEKSSLYKRTSKWCNTYGMDQEILNSLKYEDPLKYDFSD